MHIHYGYYELNNTKYTQHVFIFLPWDSWCCVSRPVRVDTSTERCKLLHSYYLQEKSMWWSRTVHQQHNICTFLPLLINGFNLVPNPSKH